MPKSDLTYRTNTDEADTKTNDTSDVIENITQKVKSAPREEGQDVRDYIQKQGTHTGLIGAVVGTIMAAASFVSELAGTIVRNLLWSQQIVKDICYFFTKRCCLLRVFLCESF